LLDAIPVNATPAAQPPPPEVPVSTLCAGIISTAQRANQARRDLAARAGWSPELTADSMRHAAANNVVTSLNAETVYRVLAVRARQLGDHALVPGLHAAADRAVGSRRAWLAVAHVWDTMVTDTRGYLSRPAAEAGHLALWTGRLAYADPAWRPARGPSPAVRDPASLAPGPAAFTQIASALHYAADSLARAAHTDLDTLRTAAAAGRLYVTTRSLPELHYDVPRPYADAPGDRVAAALAAYAGAAETSQAMLHAAAQAAAAVDAPSRVLSVAQQATAYPAIASRGRLEQNLVDLGVRDTQLLRQGAELDQMAQRILAQAHRSGLASPRPDAEAALGPGAEPHLAGEQPGADMAEIHASADAADEATGRAGERDVTRAADISEATSTEPVIGEFQAEPPLEPSWRQGAAERSPAIARELPQRGRAERIAVTDAEAAETPVRPRESPVIGPAAAAQRTGGQTARVEVGRQARAEVVAQAYPATGAEAARYGAAAQAKTEAEAEPPSLERRQYLENMAEYRAGTGAIGGRAEQAGPRAQIGQELASEPPAREPGAEPELEASWQHGQAERLSAAAAPDADASLDAPEVGGAEPELGL
jgi:hypothetical protein